MDSVALTALQRDHLLRLMRVGALAKERGASLAALTNAGDGAASAMVTGKLRDKGLVGSRTRQRARQQWTEYWLTFAGERVARRLLEEEA